MPFRCLLLASCLTAPFLLAQDPESTAAGRTTYLGRTIAQTMHWEGAPWLLRDTREAEENGALLHRWLAVQPGQRIADLGCGNGYHTFPLARAAGREGLVFAVDLQPRMLELLQLRAEKDQLQNIRLVEATTSDPKLAPSSCDLVLMVDVYHELSHPVSVMQRVKRALRTGGRCVLVEFRAEDEKVPIKPEHTMTKAQVVREMASHGFVLQSEFDELPWQHAMAFAVAEEVDGAPADARLAPREVARAFARAAATADERTFGAFLADGVEKESVVRWPQDAHVELAAGNFGRVVVRVQPRKGELGTDADEFTLRLDAEGRWNVEGIQPHAAFLRMHGGTVPFVAMHTLAGRGPASEVAERTAEARFDGVAWDLEDLASVRRACEQKALDVHSAYFVLDLGKDVDAAALAPVLAAMHALRGGPGAIWLAMNAEARGEDDAEVAGRAAVALRKLASEAEATGVEVALYPHHGFWLATLAHAERLAKQHAHPRLGVCFNLCHFLREGRRDVGPALRALRERLLAVTLSGADEDGTDWSTLIRPLGEGTFDLRLVLRELDAMGYEGPVGIQGFGLAGEPRLLLLQAASAWRRLHAR